MQETEKTMKPLLEKYLNLSANSSKSEAREQERMKDHYSHFILRLAFAGTEDLRRRFSRAEAMLFRLRWMGDDARERQAFVESLSLDWETVGEEERRVFLKAGKAYVPGREQLSMVVAEFGKRLDAALEVPLFPFPFLRWKWC
jgi:DNA primase large subunit